MSDNAQAFAVFTEIGIIHQLATRVFERRLPQGMNLPQFSVLHHLIRLGGDWSPARLANAFQVTRSTMTHTLQRLEIAGFIEMPTNSNDGRAKLVCITPLGQTTCQAAIGAVAADIEALSVMLPVELMPSIHSGLATLRKVLDTQR